jgi:hypothetical protein
MKSVSNTFLEEIKIHVLCSVNVFRKSNSFEIVEKYGGAREAANGNMAVRCMPGKARSSQTHA